MRNRVRTAPTYALNFALAARALAQARCAVRTITIISKASISEVEAMLIKDKIFLASQYLAPHHLVSRMFGYASDCREAVVKN